MFLLKDGSVVDCLCADLNWIKFLVVNGACKRCGQRFFDFSEVK